MKLGADKYIATNDDKYWATHHARSLDLIVSSLLAQYATRAISDAPPH